MPKSLAWKRFPIREFATLAFFWLGGIALVAVIGWAALFNHLRHEKARAEQRALLEVSTLSRSYAAHLAQTLSAIDQLILSIKYGWESSAGQLRLDIMKERGIFVLSSDFYVAIFDAQGNLITNTVPGSAPVNAAAAPFFINQKQVIADYLYIDKPATGLYTRRDVLRFSRKLLNRNGQFAGIVLVSVATDYFTNNYKSMGLGNHDLLGVAGDDQILRTARIGETVYQANTPAFAAIPIFPSTPGTAVWDGTKWFVDKRTRYIGWAPISQYSLMAITGLDMQDALVPFQEYRSFSLRNATWATVVFAVLGMIAAALSMRLGWRKQLHHRLQKTYRMATEIGAEGFFIIQPMRNNQGAIIDFEFVDCNRRGAEFLRRTPIQVVGQKMSDFYAGRIPRQTLEILQDAIREGEYEAEIELPDDSPINMKWMYFKLVRSGAELAMTVRDISSSKAHLQELEKRSNEDSLTGLPNRHWADNYLPRAITNAKHNKVMLALLFLDLDGFKAINDTMGHDAGDELLKNIARRLKVAIRPGDYVIRMGGDEFVVVLENIQHQKDVVHVADRVIRSFQKAFKLTKGMCSVGTSIGIGMFPVDGSDADALLRNADIAMYSAKAAGKGNYRFYDGHLDEVLNARRQLEGQLRGAIERDEFLMYYQPRISLLTGGTSGMEALVRWAHPTREILEPNEFLPMAEETNLIIPLGELVINKVCAQLAEWAKSGRQLAPISINVSPHQINNSHIVQILEKALQNYHVAANLVELEITESAMMGNMQGATSTLQSIQQMGIKLLVDDFGAGYSSLSRLRSFNFDILKVDSILTSELGKNDEAKTLFVAIITIAHGFGMRVVAEGVENLEQIKILKEIGCDDVQGYYVSMPQPTSKLQAVSPQWVLAAIGNGTGLSE